LDPLDCRSEAISGVPGPARRRPLMTPCDAIRAPDAGCPRAGSRPTGET
jgi:hypothetical protein